MSEFENAIRTLNMGESDKVTEIDISKNLDNTVKGFIECITKFLGDVVIIRSTHESLTDWMKGNVFIEVIADTDHDNNFSTLFDIVEEFFGKCTIEPTSDIMVSSIDDNIVKAKNESIGKSLCYILYRR